MITKRWLVGVGLTSVALVSVDTSVWADDAKIAVVPHGEQAAKETNQPKSTFTAQPLGNPLTDDEQAMEDVADALGDKIPARPGIEQLQIERLGSAVLNQRSAK